MNQYKEDKVLLLLCNHQWSPQKEWKRYNGVIQGKQYTHFHVFDSNGAMDWRKKGRLRKTRTWMKIIVLVELPGPLLPYSFCESRGTTRTMELSLQYLLVNYFQNPFCVRWPMGSVLKTSRHHKNWRNSVFSFFKSNWTGKIHFHIQWFGANLNRRFCEWNLSWTPASCLAKSHHNFNCDFPLSHFWPAFFYSHLQLVNFLLLQL